MKGSGPSSHNGAIDRSQPAPGTGGHHPCNRRGAPDIGHFTRRYNGSCFNRLWARQCGGPPVIRDRNHVSRHCNPAQPLNVNDMTEDQRVPDGVVETVSTIFKDPEFEALAGLLPIEALPYKSK